MVLEAVIASLLSVDSVAHSLHLGISSLASSFIHGSQDITDSVELVGLLNLWLLHLRQAIVAA